MDLSLTKIKIKDYRVSVATAIDLAQWPTKVPDLYRSKKDYRKTLESQVESLSRLQRSSSDV